MYWEDMREEQFPIAIGDFGGLCVLPLSSIEKKGEHLPVGADGFIVDAIIKEAAEREDVVVFPTGYWLGDVSATHMTKANGETMWYGAIEMSQELQITVLEELCDEIARNGFRKILIVYKQPFNSVVYKQLSNSILVGLFLRHMSYHKKPYSTLIVDAVNEEISRPENVLKTINERRTEFPMITDEDIKTLEKWAETGYGGKNVTFCDTAMVMANYEELVAKERYEAEDYGSTHLADCLQNVDVTYANMWNMNYPNGCCGFPPHGCTKGIGEAILKINAEFMAGVFKVIKEDEKCVSADARYPSVF